MWGWHVPRHHGASTGQGGIHGYFIMFAVVACRAAHL
eukprot:CAMPEP_0179327580 /NCGR_PEP_ID=MMETSP0797-20121207/62037_1 /TAXON_ID=47934 /ORGANISM="Dinophysis acuminata, Strain DAEP01" /LENGTH=36 /DNA_ID= /DNA_START= /DNA_END= /DNA_ORIENTATION=